MSVTDRHLRYATAKLGPLLLRAAQVIEARLLKGRGSGSGWWAAAAIGGWWLGWMLSIAVLEALSLWRPACVPGLDGQQHGLQGLVVGSTYGLLTGMVWLRFGQAAPALGRML
jgi:hypothetical protein